MFQYRYILFPITMERGMNDTEIITVREAADILGITNRGVVAAIHRGALKAQKFGDKNWALLRGDVEHYRDTRRPTGPRPKGENDDN